MLIHLSIDTSTMTMRENQKPTDDQPTITESGQSGATSDLGKLNRSNTSPSMRTTNINADAAEQEGEPPRERRSTAYERLSHDLNNDHRCLKEITLGKRIAFYRLRGELGTGNFSQVKMGVHLLTKEKVAIKILDKTKLDTKTQRLLSREITSMEQMHHPNIIRLYEVIETLTKLHMVMEYAPGGELFTKISSEGKLPENDCKMIYSQIVAAVKHMHEKGIIHRDLKAENVFYAGPHFIKIGDFGFSTVTYPEQTLHTFCGSPPYAAPELFRDESYYGAYVDIWAIGIMLFFIVSGLMPFRAENVSKLKKCIIEGNYNIPVFVTDSCQFLIRNILKPLPKDRFTIEEIMRSDWLTGQEFPEALAQYSITVDHESEGLSTDEQEARKILGDLGIEDEHFRNNFGKDSRSSITGTYRIVLHKVQKKSLGNHEDNTTEDDGENNVDSRFRNQPLLIKKQSKFCAIL